MTQFVAEARKFIAALTAFGGVVVANQLVHGSALRYTNAAIALGGAVLVYVLPNDKADLTATGE